MPAKMSVHTMFLDKHNSSYIKNALLALLILSLSGCGLREPQTGSLRGRLFNAQGDVVQKAQIYSLFKDEEKVYSASDGSFYLAELPAGRNTIVFQHPDYSVETRIIEVLAGQMTDLEFVKLDEAGISHRISDVTVESTASTSAVISWNTYKSIACSVDYGIDQNYGRIFEELAHVDTHKVTLTDLTPETLYRARIRFTDDSSMTYFSHDFPFKTSRGDAPSPPETVSFKCLESYGVIQLEWELSSSSSVVGYQVSRRENNGEWSVITSDILDGNSREFHDTAAQGGSFYEYAVKAVADDGSLSSAEYSQRIFMPGVIAQDLTFSQSDSPIDLVSDLIVGVGTTLFVEPGVEFRIAESDAFRLGLNPDKVEILVHGRAEMKGSSDLPIKFTPLDGSGSNEHWAGISIQNGRTGVSSLAHLQLFGCVEYALKVDGVPALIENLSIRRSKGGIYCLNITNPPALKNCLLEDIEGSAITVSDCRRFDITGCTVINAETGITSNAGNYEDKITVRETSINAYKTGITGTFNNSVIANTLVVVPDGIGIEYQRAISDFNFLDHCTIDAMIGVSIASGLPVIENNIIVSTALNGKSGIRYLIVGIPEFSYNNLYGFTDNYDNCLEGTGATRFQPDFVAGKPYDYHLQPNSPLSIRDRNGLEMGRYGLSYR